MMNTTPSHAYKTVVLLHEQKKMVNALNLYFSALSSPHGAQHTEGGKLRHNDRDRWNRGSNRQPSSYRMTSLTSSPQPPQKAHRLIP